MLRSIKCKQCKGEMSNNEVALNFKILGKQISKLYCYECLSIRLECEVDQLRQKAIELKRSGCALFKIDY